MITLTPESPNSSVWENLYDADPEEALRQDLEEEREALVLFFKQEDQQPVSTDPFVTLPIDGALSVAALDVPVAPVKGGEKAPPIPDFQNVATTSEEKIKNWHKERPNCNWLALAKPNGVCFIDEDQSERLRSLYQERYGEPYPRTRATGSQPNHRQSYWRQTDRTRAFGNRAQSLFVDRMMSFRQCDQYCMVEGSHLNPSKENGPNHRDYILADESPIAEMPDRLMDLIESLVVDSKKTKEKKKRAEEPKMYIDGRPVPKDPPDLGFKKLFDTVGWNPLVRRLNKHVDDRYHDFTVGVGEPNTYCPIPSHGLQDVNAVYKPCFGVVPEEPAVLHCFGCEWSGDMVAACYEVDADKTKTMYDVTRAICAEENLNFQDFFPQAAPVAPAVTSPITLPVSESVEWGEPARFDSSLRSVQPFKIEFLPRSLQPWVKDVSERMSVSLDFGGICALVSLAGVINRRAFVCPKANDKDWKEAINLWGAVVASSGKLKTPTWKVFMHILVEQDVDWLREYEAKKAEYDQKQETWEKLQKAAEKTNKNKKVDADLESGEQNDIVSVPTQPEEILAPRQLVVHDATPEALHTIMGSNPAGIIQFRDEMASWVAELDMKGREVERGLYLTAGNGNDYYSMARIGRGFVPAIMSLSLFGGFQPTRLVEFLGNSGNISDGMIPRFGLLVWPDDVELPIIDRAADGNAKEVFRRVIRTLAALDAESVFLHFDAPSQSRFNEWYADHSRRVSQEENVGRQSHLSKYRGLLPKLAGLLQVADLAASMPSIMGHHSIDLSHLEQAIALLVYLESHMNRVYACIKNSNQKAEESLAKHVRTGDLVDGFTIRDVERKGWEDLKDRNVIQYAIDSMEDWNWIRETTTAEKRRGKPTTRYEINPALRKSR